MPGTTRRQFIQSSAAGVVALATPFGPVLAAKRGGVMRMGKAHGQTVDSLDPATHENGFTIAMTHGYNNYMTEVAGDGSLAGQIAESWEASADVGTWTFKLRQGVTFHNGREVTAEDVVASINHHRGEESTSAAKPIVEPITDIKADGTHTVVFTLNAGNADFPFILSDYHLPILPSEGGKADWQSGIGAGAYRIKSFDPGVRIDLERYARLLGLGPRALRRDPDDHHRGPDRPHQRPHHRPGRRHRPGGSEDRAPAEAPGQGLKVHSIAGTQHYTFPMRTNVAPFDDNNVRMAIKHAINREEMVEKILQGFGVVGNDHPIGPGQRFFAKDLEQRTYDPDKAKHYLKQAGMDSLTVDLSVADAAFAGAVDAGALFAESAKAAGITLNLIREPNDGYWSNVWNTKPFCACYWGGRPVEDQMFSTAYASGAAWNDTAWEHERFNMLLVAARAEVDEAKRRGMYAEMQQIVRDEGGVIVPMFASYVFATSDKVATPEQMGSNWDLDGERWMERWSFA